MSNYVPIKRVDLKVGVRYHDGHGSILELKEITKADLIFKEIDGTYYFTNADDNLCHFSRVGGDFYEMP